ncbi:glycylpeptide N-tetradecanoyltransferase [Sorochytrium milnesiophthora]
MASFDKKDHKFWRTQPVPQAKGEASAGEGAIQPPKAQDEVRADPYTLPKDFEWVEVDVTNADELHELYQLLFDNYVEDPQATFRFGYLEAFLDWGLKSPGWKKFWHVGVRVVATKKLVAFISGIPTSLRVVESRFRSIEINFLCVHKKLRNKRLAPVLIKEITRRCHLEGIFQALYTSGVELPGAVAQCRCERLFAISGRSMLTLRLSWVRYWHRSLQYRKLVAVGFAYLPPNKTMEQMEKRLALPEVSFALACEEDMVKLSLTFLLLYQTTSLPGIRPMTKADVPGVHVGLNAYLKRFKLAPEFSPEEIEYMCLPRGDFLYGYVVENPQSKEITHFISFYRIPSQTMGSEEYKDLQAAFTYFYFFPTPENGTALQRSSSAAALFKDALVLAKQNNFDVFNALELMDNMEMLEACKFNKGDGVLKYYLYNWRVPGGELAPNDVGIILH